MTCHHLKGDPNCGSSASNYASAAPATPDSSNYSIEEAEWIGPHMVVKVKYPNCRNCAYEGNKVMVFLDISATQALKWKKIDPHFRAPQRVDIALGIGKVSASEAPSPAARFPGSPEGWQDALDYARGKTPEAKTGRKPSSGG